MDISVIISYSSNESIFIDALVTECEKFSDDIVISHGSHFYDGQPEDHTHMKECVNKYPQVQFVTYDVDTSISKELRKGCNTRPSAYWHNLSRWTAISALKKQGWVFVIDADEIPDGDLLKYWISKLDPSDLNPECCYKFACYWYFKSPQNRATTIEDSVLLIHRKHLTEDNVFGDDERDHLIRTSNTRLLRQVKDLQGRVMWHHFSFVRSKEGLITKISTWGHKDDIFKQVNPTLFVDYLFKDDNVNDIVHNYQYITVDNKFNIDINK